MIFCRTAAAVVLVSLLSSATMPVVAFERQVPSGASISSISLLSLENVQAELRLSDEQKNKLARVRTRLQSSLQAAIMGGENQGAPPLAGGADKARAWNETAIEDSLDPGTRMLAQLKKVETDAQTVLDKLLSEAQRRRLWAINLQAQGAGALSDPDVIRKLQLTPEQQKRLADIQKATSQRRLQLITDSRKSSSQERGLRLEQLRKEEMRLKYAVLTKTQLAMFQRMMGRKIPLDMNQAMRFMRNS